MLKKVLLSLAITSLATPVVANETLTTTPQFGLYAGLTFGGDTLGGLEYKNGDTEEVTSGGLFAFGVSLRTEHNDTFVSKLNAGYHFDSTTAKNADVTFDRYAFEALTGYKIKDNITLYGGISYHLSVEYLEEMYNISKNTMGFDNALGFVVEGAYHIDNSSEVTLRYVTIDYDVSTINNSNIRGLQALDGNHIGIFYFGYF